MPRRKRQQDQDQSENQSSEDQQNQLKINTDNSPKIIPVAKLPDKPKYKKIVINVSDTQYPIVTQVAEELGWILQQQEGAGDWDVWWTDREIQPNTLYRMNLHQKINHFPGIYVLARKNLLGLHLMGMQKRFPDEYNFFPQSWMLPMQFSQFRQYYQSIEEGKVRTYIVKPQALSQGRGIFLTRNIEDVTNGHKYVVQRYMKNPLLLDGLKFDLRIYVLLAGSEPLKLYIYQEGLARLATRPYQQPTGENLHENFIHLTNYSLNKTNPDYVYNKSEKQMDVGHKRSLKGVYQKLAKTGIDVQKLKTQIEDCITKTVISGLPSIRHQYKYCQPEQYEGNMCFHILGFDVMILDDLTPIVIQVNHTPSFQTGTPLDYQIKKKLIQDTLKLKMINSDTKKNLFFKSKQLTKKRVQTGKREILKGQQRTLHLAQVQKLRDEQEKKILFDPQHPSGYKAIFPFKDQTKNQLYAKFYEGAEKVMRQQKDIRKRIISEQNTSPKKQASMNRNKVSKTKNIQILEPTIQRSSLKKESVNSRTCGFGQNTKQKNNAYNENRQTYNIDKGSSNSETQSKELSPEKVVQKSEGFQTKMKEDLSTPNISGAYNSEKRIVNSKGMFQIRNNVHGRKNSLNNQDNQRAVSSQCFVPQQQGPQVNKYEELIEKYVKNKDLDDSNYMRVAVQGQVVLSQKQKCAKISRNSKEQEYFAKIPGGTISILTQVKGQVQRQKLKYNKNQTNFVAVKGYKQKLAPNIHQQNIINEKQRLKDPQINKGQHHMANKNIRSPGSQGQGNYNDLNIISKPYLAQNCYSNAREQPFEGQIITVFNAQQSKNQRNDSKIGRFLKPKTYNLHQNKFPHQQKYVGKPGQGNPSLVAYYNPQIQGLNQNVNLSGGVLNSQQYKQLYSAPTIGSAAIQIVQQGYGARHKIHVNKKNMSSFVSVKPSTSHKNKSSSVVFKSSQNQARNNPTLMRLVDKSKIKEFQ